MLSFIATAGLSLLLASTAFFLSEIVEFRRTMVRNLSTLTRVIGTNSKSPLMFGDGETAGEILASIAVDEHIRSAAVFDDEGQLFVSYLAPGVPRTELPEAVGQGHAFVDGRLDLFEPIETDGQRLGTAFLSSDTDRLVGLIELFALIFGGVTLGALGISYLGATWLRKDIAKPLQLLVESSARMAGGDLSVRVDIERKDELGTLADGFNAMATSLSGLIAKVSGNTRAVGSMNDALQHAGASLENEAQRQGRAVEGTASSIERINESIQSVGLNVETLTTTVLETSSAQTQMDSSIALMASHMDELSSTIDGTASTVEEMTSGIRGIAESADALNSSAGSTAEALDLLSSAVKQVEGNARETHTLSEKTFRQAEEGGTSVEETVEGMKEIQVSFRGLESIISNLSEKSESIGAIVKVIEGVVEQTTLLALNAAIISAQAGEHGRSFSVVAEEVGNLAERTAGSTREIRTLIEGVQGSVTAAVSAMDHGRTRVEQGVDLTNRAGNLLQTIGESAHESTARVREIVSSSENQALDIEKVGSAMSQLKQIAAQLNRGANEQDNARADIIRAVEQIRQLGKQVGRSTEEQRKESSLISGSIQTVADRIEQILSATRDQTKQGEQIVEALKIFRGSTQESNLRRAEMHKGLAQLARRSEELEAEIGRFQL